MDFGTVFCSLHVHNNHHWIPSVNASACFDDLPVADLFAYRKSRATVRDPNELA